MNDRYLRNNMIDWFDQSIVSSLNTIVVGAGAIGNEVIKNLALMGVKNIKIYDLDTIEAHNLTKSILFSEDDIGKLKAEVAAKKAKELDPNINPKAIHGDIFKKLGIADVLDSNIIFCCLDNFETRLRINELCVLTKTPMINLSIDSRYASVEVFTYQDEDRICYECNLPLSAYERISKRYSCGYLKKISYIEKKIPTTIMTSAASASIGVSLGLQVAVGKDDININPSRSLLDTRSGKSSYTQYSKNPDCPTCNNLGKQINLIPISRKKLKDINNLLPDAKNLLVRFPESLVSNINCKKCNKIFSEDILAARDLSDDVYFCELCKDKSVELNFLDDMSVGTFVSRNLHQDIFDLIPYFFVATEDIEFCFYEEN